ncbi:MAG: ABC transporter permease [Bacilli bacterium]|nr:ABC transporter permease [Bacilli bacterium]
MFKGLVETLYMVLASTILAYLFGLPLGVLVVVTQKDGIKPNRPLNLIIGTIINIFRSIPFLILLVLLIPVTRFIIGTSIGSTAMIVPLTFASTCFVARLVETSLKEIDKGVIEQAIVMGATPMQIIFKVFLVEATPALIRGLAITGINLIGYSAMAGTVAGGGLGDIAIRFGYYKYNYKVMLLTVFIMVLVVQMMQFIFDRLARRVDKKRS